MPASACYPWSHSMQQISEPRSTMSGPVDDHTRWSTIFVVAHRFFSTSTVSVQARRIFAEMFEKATTYVVIADRTNNINRTNSLRWLRGPSIMFLSTYKMQQF
ncbi:U1 [Hyposoter didymator ichnovirus]|nr:U1 [Hyposoter didymator ichnovirus]